MNRAVSVYHDLLDDPRIARESAERLQSEQRAKGLMFGDRPVSIALRPKLLSRRDYDSTVRAASAIYDALQALERALLVDPALRAELDLDPMEEKLALADPGFPVSSTSARVDGFFTDRLRYVEYNAESPAGMAYSDVLTGVLETLPIMRAFRRRYRIRSLPVRRPQVSAMLRAFRAWGKARTPVVAIVDWGGLPTRTEFEMFKAFFGTQGITCCISDPRELEFRGGRLHASGLPVNLVYRRVLTTELLTRDGAGGALTEAYLAGAACVVNSFRAKLLHKKMSLALLSDDEYAHLYSATQRRAIARHIPWTRKLRQGATRRDGWSIPDLAAYVSENRTELVLKPNDEYGGKGVVLGWTVDQEAWDAAIAAGLTQSTVVQEAVPVPREIYPILVEGIQFLELAYDTDPYLFDGKPLGCMTRLSSSALLNVTAGAGSMVPVYVVEGAT
jgi:hypothetical protein